jgi:formyltetrahydrofolate deformylase
MSNRSEKREFASIGVFGRDRTGVVARVTANLFKAGGNIEELIEQVSRREFHMNLVASWPAGKMDRVRMAAELKTLGGQLGMDIVVRFRSPRQVQRMAILVTRETHCLEALMAGVRSGTVNARPVLVAGNHREAAGLARRYRLPFVHADFAEHATAETKLLAALEDHEADFVVLARFMKILSPRFAWRWRNRIINIHPSLLPAFPGASAYRQAYDRGVKVVGVTAHFVTPDLDGGPIICQDTIRLKPNESLESIVKRGREIEAKVLVRAVRLYLANLLDVYWGKVAYV